MEETPTASGLLNESHPSQECPNENSHSLPDGLLWSEQPWKIQAAAMDPMYLASHNLGQSYNKPGISSEVVPSLGGNVRRTPLASPNLAQSHNQPGRSSGVGPSQNSNVVSTRLAFQSPNNSNGSFLERKNSSLSGPERDLRKRAIDQACDERCMNNSSLTESDPAKMRKREIDKAYRERCKKQKTQKESDIKNLKGENDSLQKENKSLKHDNSLMNQTLTDKAEEIGQLRSALSQVKREHEKQNVLLQTLSGFLSETDPMRLEVEKLKAENALLRMNATLDSNLPRLAEENAKLMIENKTLKVLNDALCGKIVSDDDDKK